MAAALIPLIAGLAPEIINLIVSLVHPKAIAAEQLGTGTGPVKFANVFVAVMQDLAKAHAAGTISVLPDDATVKTIIQSVVVSMQLSGFLGGTAPTPVTDVAATPSTPLRAVSILPGQSITISVAS
jgi:hypothetical protein